MTNVIVRSIFHERYEHSGLLPMLVMQFKVMINELQQYQCTDYSYDLKHKRQFKPFLFIQVTVVCSV